MPECPVFWIPRRAGFKKAELESGIHCRDSRLTRAGMTVGFYGLRNISYKYLNSGCR
jgi:hypothetical protein